MWKNKCKAVTFSYDDGVTTDRKLVEIFNRYGLKATFNLSSGIQSYAHSFDIKGIRVHQMNAKELPLLYKGHEIAVHCLTHANLLEWDDETIYNEINNDRFNLERLFQKEICGMAYPFGAYDGRVMKIAADCGICYARTTMETGTFKTCGNLLAVRPSAHHDREDLFGMIDRFLNLPCDQQGLLYIWGHSYEFEVDRQ